MTNKGYTKKGTISETPNQTKMYINDVEQVTLDRLLKYAHNNPRPLSISYHLRDKLKSGKISIAKKDILKVITKDIDWSIVEVNETKGDLRILIRGLSTIPVTLDGKENIPANLCVSYSVTKNRIITAYYNRVTDNHLGMHKSRYKKFDIDKVLDRMIRKDKEYAKNHRKPTAHGFRKS